jgi:tetratricopeptide (TPR) repeat protein
MTLANIAWILASRGLRVLVVDWDLEAPGVHRYFRPFLIDADLVASDGVIDMVIDYATDAVTAGPEQPDWYRKHADVTRLAVTLDHEFDGGGRLALLPAGRQGPSYSTRVNTFDWRGFYERLSGGAFLDAVKDRMRESYDYILVDSRTGVSDTAGICTVQLPDTLVVCFTLNDQNIDGAAGIAASVLEQRSDGLRVFPVPMRIEMAEKEKLEQRRAFCRRRFALFPNGIADAAKRQAYWGAVEVLYVPFYAYEEILAPMGDAPGQTSSLLASCERLTSYLTDGEVTSLSPMAETARIALLARYAERRDAEPSTESLDAAAERVYARLSKEEQAAAREVFTRLVHVPRPGKAGQPTTVPAAVADVPQLTASELAGLNALFTAGLLHTDTDTAMGEAVVVISNPDLPARWQRLGRWIDEDRDFLAWRQDLQSAELQWRLADRAGSSLLYGERLDRARQWTATHGWKLSPAERAYVDASDMTARRRRRGRVVRNVVVGGFGAAFVIATMLNANADRRSNESAEWLSTARQFAGTNQADSAEKYFRQVLTVDPNSNEAHLGIAEAQMLLGDAAAAERSYSQALAIAPFPDSLSVPVHRGRAEARLVLGDVEGAISDWTDLLRRDNTDVDALFRRGEAYQAVGDTAAAVGDFEEVIQLSGDASTREAALTRLEQLGRDPPVQSEAPRTLVYIQVRTIEDRKIGVMLKPALESAGFTVLGTEVRAEPTRGDVRSFFTGDREAAERAASVTESRLAREGYRIRLQRMELDSANFPGARRRLIEIWLPPLTAQPSRGVR